MLLKQPKVSILLPLLFLIFGTLIVGYEFKQELINTGWVKGEFYLTTFLNFIFIIILTIYLHFYLQSKNLVLHYLMSAGIIGSLLFYWYASLSYDPAFPTLAALLLVAILFITPGLLSLRLVVFFIEKYQTRKLKNPSLS